MAVQEIKGDEYVIEHNDSSHVVGFKGTIRLQTTDDYAPITDLLQKAHGAAGKGKLTLDFRQLQFLNSSGINAISKFVIAARKEDKVSMVVLGSQDIYWQQKSLSNLSKLWSKVQVDIV
ncbi:MAG: hypothetical protein FD146_2312 [Anaerolineaceae bacterium]|nr:MAG: hypothetical protein FD146_2312 [Anaerolineaceae bacterium]